MMRVAREIAHHFELIFLPTKHALFHQDFVDGREVDAALQNLFELFTVVSDAAAGTAHSEAGTQDDGIADAVREVETRFNVVDELRLRHVEADFAHRIFEQEAIFRFLDGVDLGADQFDAVLVEHARLSELNREVEAGLAADGGEQRIRTLLADHFGGECNAQWLDIGAVSELRIRHDRRRDWS